MGMFKKKEEAMITVEGMTCEHCESKAEGAAVGVTGVRKAKADRVKNQVSLVLDSSDDTVLDSVVAAINETGYSASKSQS